MDEIEIIDWLSQSKPPVRRDGSLTEDEVAGTMTAYFQNAQSFFDEVLILHKAARTPRACALCVLGLEELAKIPLLFDTFMKFERGIDREAWIKYWKGGGSHKKKQEMMLAYGQVIRLKVDGEPMFSKRLYRLYAPDTLFTHLDSFKQSNFADSFRSWHMTKRRSSDHLEVALGRKSVARWTSSYTVEEVKGDILYQASSLSASQVPNYYTFRDFVNEYRKRPSKNHLEQALLGLANDVRIRCIAATDLPLYYARSIGILKMLIGLTDPDTLLGSSFSRKFREALLEKI